MSDYTKARHMPAQGGFSVGKPDGWVPADDDNPRRERYIEHRVDALLADVDGIEQVLSAADTNYDVRFALQKLIRATRQAEDPGRSPSAGSFHGYWMRHHASSLVQALTAVAERMAVDEADNET